MSINFESSDIQELMSKLNCSGKIEDKEIAIKLLMITPNAWMLLSKELRKDKEIMLYYQPEGYIESESGPTSGAYIPENVSLYCNEAFVIDGIVEVPGYASIKIHSLVPKCVLRRGNNFVKAYISVQKRMKLKQKNNQDLEEIKESDLIEKMRKMNSIHGYCNLHYDGPTDGYYSDTVEYIFDKSNLEQIVQEEYQKFLGKTK